MMCVLLVGFSDGTASQYSSRLRHHIAHGRPGFDWMPTKSIVSMKPWIGPLTSCGLRLPGAMYSSPRSLSQHTPPSPAGASVRCAMQPTERDSPRSPVCTVSEL